MQRQHIMLGEARIVGAEQLRADGGTDAVGADHRVGFDLAAVGEARHRDCRSVESRRCSSALRWIDALRQRVAQQLMQVRRDAASCRARRIRASAIASERNAVSAGSRRPT